MEIHPRHVDIFQREGHDCLYTNSASLSFFLCLYRSKGGSSSLGSIDSNGQQELQMAENLIYFSREEGKKRHVTLLIYSCFKVFPPTGLNDVSQLLFFYLSSKCSFHNMQRVSQSL